MPKKYNLHYHWISSLVLEAKTAPSYIPCSEQDSLRYYVAKNIEHLYTHSNKSNNITYNMQQSPSWEANTVC